MVFIEWNLVLNIYQLTRLKMYQILSMQDRGRNPVTGFTIDIRLYGGRDGAKVKRMGAEFHRRWWSKIRRNRKEQAIFMIRYERAHLCKRYLSRLHPGALVNISDLNRNASLYDAKSMTKLQQPGLRRAS